VFKLLNRACDLVSGDAGLVGRSGGATIGLAGLPTGEGIGLAAIELIVPMPPACPPPAASTPVGAKAIMSAHALANSSSFIL